MIRISRLIFLMLPLIVFLSGCVNRIELRTADSLEAMIYTAINEDDEEGFCNEFSDFYQEEKSGYLSCAGVSGHYQYLKGLSQYNLDTNNLNVLVESDDELYTYYINIDDEKVIIAFTSGQEKYFVELE